MLRVDAVPLATKVIDLHPRRNRAAGHIESDPMCVGVAVPIPEDSIATLASGSDPDVAAI
jgi:hypothetical protein